MALLIQSFRVAAAVLVALTLLAQLTTPVTPQEESVATQPDELAGEWCAGEQAPVPVDGEETLVPCELELETRVTPTPSSTPTATPAPTRTPTATAILPFSHTGPFGIRVQGDASCIASTQTALEALQRTAPTHYEMVRRHVGIIACAPTQSGMYVLASPPTYQVGDATRAAGPIWYASTIVHDANHSKLYQDYVFANQTRVVPDEIWRGRAAEAQCLRVQRETLQLLGAPQHFIAHIDSVLSTEYWNVPHEHRTW